MGIKTKVQMFLDPLDHIGVISTGERTRPPDLEPSAVGAWHAVCVYVCVPVQKTPNLFVHMQINSGRDVCTIIR